ncbi:unnamed protein product [Closterium sp. Naga37s-1]|nr:unnamed protein product [Closterium sp. Naga37s-1]
MLLNAFERSAWRIVASLCVLMYDLAAWIIASLPPWTATQYWSGRKWARVASASEESADFAARHRTHSPTAMGRVPPSGLARAMRRKDVSREHTSSGSFPWSIVLTRAWRWVVTTALAIAASLRCSNVIPDGPPPTPFSQRHRIFVNAAEVMVTTWASSVGVQSICPGGVDAARAGVATFTRLSTAGAASPLSPPLPSVIDSAAGWAIKPASPPFGSRSPVLGHAPQLAAARICLHVMPVAVGGGSPVPYSPRPFGVALAALASPVQSAPVAPVAAMSVAGSPPHACSTVVDSGRESAGVAVQPRVVAPAPVPAFVLAPAADVAPLPAPGAAPSPAPHVPVLSSPAETAAVAGVAPASGVAPPPVPVALPVVSPAASLGAPGGESAPPLPAASASAHALPPAVQQRNSRPHSPSPQDERATIADVRQIVIEAFRDGQAGPASQKSSRRTAPTPSAPLPVARPVVAPTPAVSLPSAPARGGGAGLPRLQLPSLAEELLPPRAEVPEATLGQLWRLSESLRALLLVQSLAHGSLPPVPAESLFDGPRDDCLDAADQIALLLAPVLAAPVRGGVGAVGQLDAAVRDLRRYLRAGSGADAIGAAILVVRSVWQTMTGILHALQADRM